ncbi:MAG: helix-turn-helix domain-containing protein [Oscillospiraceae bacterium]|nr:helix-turn-helix domain-containing protein [Oscillospiraceae bacterium]
MGTQMEKESFGAYITEKRKEAGLTQEELAQRLYLSNTTVSKWERGLSYPDIALVTDICRELNISEHEFFTACDDVAASRQKADAEAYHRQIRRVQQFFLFSYAATLIICLICNLAVDHTLSWFWIVLTSLMLAFSFTNVPLMVTERKGEKCLGSATVNLFLLLFACWAYTHGPWLGFSIAVAAVSLALPWGIYYLARFCPKHRGFPALIMSYITIWNVFLVLLCVGVTGGSLQQALTITLISYISAWCIFAVAVYLPVSGCLKAAAICFLADFSIPYFQLLMNQILNEAQPNLYTLSDYFQWGTFLNPASLNVNVLVFAIGLIGSVVVLGIGIFLQCRKYLKEHAKEKIIY